VPIQAVTTLLGPVATATGATASPVNIGTSTGTIPVNKFAVLVEYENIVNPPVWTFEVSWDGQTFAQVKPAAQRGNVFIFDTPALEVTASYTGNVQLGTIFAQILAYTD